MAMDAEKGNKRSSLLARRGPSALVWLACLVVFLWKVQIVAPIQLVGLVDPAAYADMALSLLSGRGLEVDYISMHFLKFPAAISHPEETWPPFYSLLIVPFFAVLGKGALAAKLPSLLISSLCLPPISGALAFCVTRSRVVAFATAITVLLSGALFHWSLFATADLTFGFLVTAAIFLAVQGNENPRWYLLWGVTLACAYYAKGAAIVLLPAFILYYLLRRSSGRTGISRTRQDLWFVGGLALLCLLLTPWFVRNTACYGDPLYCTHKHVAGYVGVIPWEEGTYKLYWDEGPPSPWDKLEDPGRLLRNTWYNIRRQVRLLFLKMDDRIFLLPYDRLEPITFRDISTYWTGLPALLGIWLYLGGGLTGLILRFRKVPQASRVKAARFLKWMEPFLRPEYALFLLVGGSLLGFLVVFWAPTSRYTLPLIPLMILLGWATTHAIARALFRFTSRSNRVAGAFVLVLLAVWAVHEGGDLLDARENRGYPWKDTGEAWIAMGEWIHENAPGSVTLTRNPWGLNYYSGEKAVQIPYGPLEDVLRVAEYYGATLLIPDSARPALRPWVLGTLPGLHRIHREKHLELYVIDYETVPASLRARSSNR